MDDEQSGHFKRIDDEIAWIDAGIAKLVERKHHLVRLRSKVWAERCLRPGDRVTEKNARKFEVLGSVYFVLATLEPVQRRKGLTTYELFNRAGKGDISYVTFRSYLNRFKKEQRLTYDERNGFWNLNMTREDKPESN